MLEEKALSDKAWVVGQEALCNKALVMKGEKTLHETWVIERGVLFDLDGIIKREGWVGKK